ncbi:MAG: cytochrome P460 family protein [Thermodesulfobacteriota bacterium]
MKKLNFMPLVLVLTILALGMQSCKTENQIKEVSAEEESYSPFVDTSGKISLPQDHIRENWEFLGSWVVPELADGSKTPGYGFHDVLASPGTAKAYRATGKFADGSVLVKEIRSIKNSSLTTGPKVLSADEELVWFVMIKDQEGKFKDNPNWGDGWGWALFTREDKGNNSSKDYKADCVGCHIPAKATDWVYIDGYPTLKK